MDTFMDKLAEKINAQEMIRANTSAELEELGQVKEQIRELKNCVNRVEEIAKETGGKAPAAASGDNDVLYILEEEVTQLGGTLAEVKDAVAGVGGSLAEVRDEVAALSAGYHTADGASQAGAGETAAEVSGELSEVKDAVAGVGGGLAEIRDELSELNEGFGRLRETAEEIQRAQTGDGNTLEELRQGMELLREEFSQVREENKSGQEEGAGAVSLNPSFQNFTDSVEHFLEDFSQCKQVFYRHKDELTELSEGFERLQEVVSEVRKSQSEDEGLLKELRKEMDIFAERLAAVSEASAAKTEETMDALKHFLVDRLSKQMPEQAKPSLEDQQAVLDEHKAQIENKLTGMHESLREGYHKECVKVYRNVQAALMEESEKQTSQLQQDMEKLRGGSSKAMIFSVLAFVAAIAGVVLQVLNLLHIF